MGLLENLSDETHSIRDVALLIRRAGLEHLICESDLSPESLVALADAGDHLEMQRVALLVKALHDPVEALRPFDGGALAKARVKAMAYALSEARNG